MNETLISSSLGILAGLLSGVLAGWFSLRKAKKDSAIQAHRELYIRQLDAYTALWEIVFRTSRYGEEGGIIVTKDGRTFLNRELANNFREQVSAFYHSK